MMVVPMVMRLMMMMMMVVVIRTTMTKTTTTVTADYKMSSQQKTALGNHPPVLGRRPHKQNFEQLADTVK